MKLKEIPIDMNLTPNEKFEIKRRQSRKMEKEIGKSPFKNKFRTSTLNPDFQNFDVKKLNNTSEL